MATICKKKKQQQKQQKQRQQHRHLCVCLQLWLYLGLCWIIYLSTTTITLTMTVTALPEIPSKGKHIRISTNESPQTSVEDNDMPRFAEPVANVTVSVGRDALLACVVENLKGFKVAWVRVDTQTILSIHHNVISQNNRISLTYNDHRSWYLHIKDVEETDRGWYMCQVNTDPMRSRKGYLQVVVPPVIIESLTSNDMVVREGLNVTLICKARGYPEPYVMWRREDGEEMLINGEHVNVVDGELLHITKVSRLHMAAYLCVASNGVPPSISKRVHLKVQFPPMLSIPNQLEGAYIGQDVNLECHTEAYPASINYWTTERGDMIISDTSRAGDKYETTAMVNGYTKYMKLKIRHVGPNDFGTYRCVAKNSLGETDGNIKLDEMPIPTTAVLSELAILNRSQDDKRRNKNKLDPLNALPDYGVEEWRENVVGIGVGVGSGNGVTGNNLQASIRNPPVSLTNSATTRTMPPFAQAMRNMKSWLIKAWQNIVSYVRMRVQMKFMVINKIARQTNENYQQQQQQQQLQSQEFVKQNIKESDSEEKASKCKRKGKCQLFLKRDITVKILYIKIPTTTTLKAAMIKWFHRNMNLNINWSWMLPLLSATLLDNNNNHHDDDNDIDNYHNNEIFSRNNIFKMFIKVIVIHVIMLILSSSVSPTTATAATISSITVRHKLAQDHHENSPNKCMCLKNIVDDENGEDNHDDGKPTKNDKSQRRQQEEQLQLQNQLENQEQELQSHPETIKEYFAIATRRTTLAAISTTTIVNVAKQNKRNISVGIHCYKCCHCHCYSYHYYYKYYNAQFIINIINNDDNCDDNDDDDDNIKIDNCDENSEKIHFYIHINMSVKQWQQKPNYSNNNNKNINDNNNNNNKKKRKNYVCIIKKSLSTSQFHQNQNKLKIGKILKNLPQQLQLYYIILTYQHFHCYCHKITYRNKQKQQQNDKQQQQLYRMNRKCIRQINGKSRKIYDDKITTKIISVNNNSNKNNKSSNNYKNKMFTNRPKNRMHKIHLLLLEIQMKLKILHFCNFIISLIQYSTNRLLLLYIHNRIHKCNINNKTKHSEMLEFKKLNFKLSENVTVKVVANMSSNANANANVKLQANHKCLTIFYNSLKIHKNYMPQNHQVNYNCQRATIKSATDKFYLVQCQQTITSNARNNLKNIDIVVVVTIFHNHYHCLQAYNTFLSFNYSSSSLLLIIFLLDLLTSIRKWLLSFLVVQPFIFSIPNFLLYIFVLSQMSQLISFNVR